MKKLRNALELIFSSVVFKVSLKQNEFIMFSLDDFSLRSGVSKVWSKGQIQPKDFPGGSDGKASVYNAGDPGLIPQLGRSPGEGNGNHSSTIAWKIPWTEEPRRLQSMGSQRVRHD